MIECLLGTKVEKAKMSDVYIWNPLKYPTEGCSIVDGLIELEVTLLENN